MDVHLLGMPIPIYISVNEDERVGGNPGLPRNKTCSNAFHQGRARESEEEEKNTAQLKTVLKKTTNSDT